MKDLIPTAAVLGIFILIGWLSYVRYLRYQLNVRNINVRFDTVLDKLGRQKEFLQFLQTENGLRLIKSLTSATASTKVPILVMISSGIISLAIGAGALFLTIFVENDLIFGAIFMSSLGCGLLIAACVSLRLSRKWGIFEENGGTGLEDEVPAEISGKLENRS